mmetsp:Transcript_17198/g.26570  ORF Transcript_17198/g.26570 Transcript_17198/m.26570 type:complete len:157 (-) Transcript_17198:3-473(-)
MSQPAKNSRMAGPSFGRQKTGGHHQKNFTSTNLPNTVMNSSISSNGGGLKKQLTAKKGEILKRGSQGQASPHHFNQGSPSKNNPSFAHSSNNLLIGGGVIGGGSNYQSRCKQSLASNGIEKPTATAPPSSSGGIHSNYISTTNKEHGHIKKRNTFK